MDDEHLINIHNTTEINVLDTAKMNTYQIHASKLASVQGSLQMLMMICLMFINVVITTLDSKIFRVSC